MTNVYTKAGLVSPVSINNGAYISHIPHFSSTGYWFAKILDHVREVTRVGVTTLYVNVTSYILLVTFRQCN